MKIGVFGGTFDPVHHGHVAPVVEIAGSLGLDRVLYVPNNRSPFKEAGPRASAFDRVAMLALALAPQATFSIEMSELSRSGPSFTLETLQELSAAHPGDELILLLGTDALSTFSRWREPERIAGLARLAAFVREPFIDSAALARGAGVDPDRILIFDSVRVKISSTEIRRRLSEGRPVAGMTPEAVENYIRKQGLYGAGAGH